MKVLLINGSPRKDGNTFTALSEIARTLNAEGVESEILWIGTKPVRGCIACGTCKTKNNGRCVFDDDVCNAISAKLAEADGFVFGSPVYYGQPNGALLAVMQRLCYSNGANMQNKPAAAVTICRRGGATAAFEALQMPLQMMNMPLVTSQYWNIAYGREEGQASQDEEGMQTMRTLAHNLAWMLRGLRGENAPVVPEREKWRPTHFIRCILVLFLALAALFPASSVSAKTKVDGNAVKSHLKQHFKPYGFVRNYFAYDSRESVSGTGDLYNFQPYDNAWNQTEAEAAASGIPREDLNDVATFRFLSITTRLGLNITDYKWRGTEFGGKIEADFYAGLSTKVAHPVSGVAQFRLRLAYLTLAWDSLPILQGKDHARVRLLMGQNWHPMAADLSDVIALNSGAPFGPFSRTPQVTMDARLGRFVTLTGAAIWQMQYMSVGPNNIQSADYILYSKTPEAYLGVSIHDKGFLMRAGADVLSICPRHLGTVTAGGKSVSVKTKDRITTASPFLYLQYARGEFSVKAKTIFAEAGEHMNLNGGYGVKAKRADGTWEYTPLRTSSSWLSIVYGGKVGRQEEKHPQKLQGILFAGYIQNLGTKEALYDSNNDGKPDELYTPRANHMNRMWRLTPTLLWTIGRFQLGCEYEITSVQYGEAGTTDLYGIARTGLHWVTNHRVQLMTKFNF